VNLNESYEDVLTLAATLGRRYLRTIRDRHVGVLPQAIDGMHALGGALPARGENPLAVLQLLDDAGSPATVASMGGRFFGGVIGGALPASVAAHWLADAWDQNACLYDISPVGAHLEDIVLPWILELLGLPSNCGGAFVTGTQMADVTALAAARSSVLRIILSSSGYGHRRRGGSRDHVQSSGAARVRTRPRAYRSR
jgi:glutamate/tyrosine decarboxylase-like PLP-dependent enzyme